MDKMYAVYSQTQFDRNFDKKKNPYIYYLLPNNEIVLITEIFHDKSKKSLFNDAKYLGEVIKFHSASNTPI
jgi:hypothetical protein